MTEEYPGYMQAMSWKHPGLFNRVIRYQIRIDAVSNGLILPLSSLQKGG